MLGLCHAVCRTFCLTWGETAPSPRHRGAGRRLPDKPLQTVFRKVLGLVMTISSFRRTRPSVCAGALGAALVPGRVGQGFDSAFKGFDAVLSSSLTVTTVCTKQAAIRDATGWWRCWKTGRCWLVTGA